MKKTQAIIGLPIISISDGMEVGKVKSLIINADKGVVDYVVVDDSKQILSTNVILTSNVLGIGEYAMTIENKEMVSDIGKIPAAVELLQKNVQIRGTKVLTKKGRLIGETGDIYIDEDSCRITALEYIADVSQEPVKLIPRESVITFGKTLLVVIEDVERTLVGTVDQLNSEGNLVEAEKKNNLISVNIQEIDRKAEDVAQAEEVVLPKEGDRPAGALNLTDEDNSASLFEQRQKQYLKGRVATKTITDNDGNSLIREGMAITEEIIENAKQNGKLIELVMNNKA